MASQLRAFLYLAVILVVLVARSTFASGFTFTACQTQQCDSIVVALFDIANSFQDNDILADTWNLETKLCEWISITCDSMGNIITINLSDQKMMGNISPSFSYLSSLIYLYLNDNGLTGQIPHDLIRLPNLHTLDLSNNNLSGKIPHFAPTVKVKLDGNPLLVLETPGGSKSISSKLIALIVTSIISFVIISSVLVYKYAKKRPSSTQLNLNNNYDAELEMGHTRFSIEVLRTATNNFNESNVLGRGGSGMVYLGELEDGSKVAIKRIDIDNMADRGINEFQVEMNVLLRVRHRNVVALLGHSVTPHHRFLVYEYMAQGTLTQHLFDSSRSSLSWRHRIIIALDVARGVHYLHCLAQESFIHRDLKPCNILLDDQMRAKVADFGLVRNTPPGIYSLSTRHIAGTHGYIAPEYAATGKITTKMDVYAYGVILMVLMTGRKALDNSLGEDRAYLVPWFQEIWKRNKEELLQVVDPTFNLDEETVAAIQTLADLAVYCTARERGRRPDMSNVVTALGPLVEKWEPTIVEEEEVNGFDGMNLSDALQRWQLGERSSSSTALRYDET